MFSDQVNLKFSMLRILVITGWSVKGKKLSWCSASARIRPRAECKTVPERDTKAPEAARRGVQTTFSDGTFGDISGHPRLDSALAEVRPPRFFVPGGLKAGMPRGTGPRHFFPGLSKPVISCHPRPGRMRGAATSSE